MKKFEISILLHLRTFTRKRKLHRLIVLFKFYTQTVKYIGEHFMILQLADVRDKNNVYRATISFYQNALIIKNFPECFFLNLQIKLILKIHLLEIKRSGYFIFNKQGCLRSSSCN